MKKKIFSLLIIAIMLLSSLFVFAGCGDEDEEETKSSKKNKTESSQSKNEIEDEEDDDEEDNDDNDDDVSSIKNKVGDSNTVGSGNTIKSDNKNTIGSGSSTSSGNIVKLTATNSELSKAAGQIQGISYGDIKIELEYDKSNEKIISAQISMSMTVTDSQMVAALDSIDLNSLFESSLSNQEYVKNAKTERVGNTIYFTADMDIEAAMADEGTEKISLEDLKKYMTESSFVVTEE